MTTRKRLLLSASILASLICVAWLVLAMLPARPGVTKANFDRIKDGMTRAEAEAILGEPREVNGPFIAWATEEGGRAAVISARFDNDKIASKSYMGDPFTLTGKISAWLGLNRIH